MEFTEATNTPITGGEWSISPAHINRYRCQGVPFEMGCSLTPVSLLQVYFLLTSRTSQWLYLCQSEFVQHLLSTWLSLLIKHKFLKTTTLTLLRLALPHFSLCLILLFVYTQLSSYWMCVSSLENHGFLPGLWGGLTNATHGHCQIFQYVVFDRYGWG